MDFIGSIACGTMQTDSKKTRAEILVVKSSSEIAEPYKRKPSWIPRLGLDFQGRWLFARVAPGEYLNTQVKNILKGRV